MSLNSFFDQQNQKILPNNYCQDTHDLRRGYIDRHASEDVCDYRQQEKIELEKNIEKLKRNKVNKPKPNSHSILPNDPYNSLQQYNQTVFPKDKREVINKPRHRTYPTNQDNLVNTQKKHMIDPRTKQIHKQVFKEKKQNKTEEKREEKKQYSQQINNKLTNRNFNDNLYVHNKGHYLSNYRNDNSDNDNDNDNNDVLMPKQTRSKRGNDEDDDIPRSYFNTVQNTILHEDKDEENINANRFLDHSTWINSREMKVDFPKKLDNYKFPTRQGCDNIMDNDWTRDTIKNKK
jgi:hypothetical protein